MDVLERIDELRRRRGWSVNNLAMDAYAIHSQQSICTQGGAQTFHASRHLRGVRHHACGVFPLRRAAAGRGGDGRASAPRGKPEPRAKARPPGVFARVRKKIAARTPFFGRGRFLASAARFLRRAPQTICGARPFL